MSKISAGEAYVTITCNDKDFIKRLQEVGQKIARTASSCPDITQTVQLKGERAYLDSLHNIQSEMKKTTEAGKSLSDRLVVTSGDVYNFASSSIKRLSNLLGGLGDKFDKMSGRTGVSTEALSEYAHAASMCGADISDVENALKQSQQRLGESSTNARRTDNQRRGASVHETRVKARNKRTTNKRKIQKSAKKRLNFKIVVIGQIKQVFATAISVARFLPEITVIQ